MITSALLALVVVVNPDFRCAENLPRCPSNRGGVLFCGAEYPCLRDDSVKEIFESRALSGQHEYAYALYLHHRWDNSDDGTAIGWLRRAAQLDYFYSRFELAEYDFQKASSDNNVDRQRAALDNLISLARGDVILEGRLGVIMAESSDLKEQGLMWLEESVRGGNARMLVPLVKAIDSSGDDALRDFWCGVYDIVSSEINEVAFFDCAGLSIFRTNEVSKQIEDLAEVIVGRWHIIKGKIDQCLRLQARDSNLIDDPDSSSLKSESGEESSSVGCG